MSYSNGFFDCLYKQFDVVKKEPFLVLYKHDTAPHSDAIFSLPKEPLNKLEYINPPF